MALQNKTIVLGVIGVVVLAGIAMYAIPRSNDDLIAKAPTVEHGVVGQKVVPAAPADMQEDIATIRSFMGDERYEVTYTTSGAPANFTVGVPVTSKGGGGGRIDIPDAWKRTVNKYVATNTIGTTCQAYLFEVYPKTHEVVEVSLIYPDTKKCGPVGPVVTGEAPKDDGLYTPRVADSAIKTAGDAYLMHALANYSDIKSQFTVKPFSKDPEVSADRWDWTYQDTSYKLPSNLSSDQKYPTIRLDVSSGGQMLYYSNSVPLFKTQ